MKIIIVFLILSFSGLLIFAQAQLTNEKPFVLGVIREMQSAELKEKRILNIYLPEDYEKDVAAKYPVIYLLDGSADEDFIHVVGLVQFNSFSWINRVPKSIVVGIATVDRRRDFTYPTTIAEDKERYPTTGHSNKFIAFIEKELQPFIEQNYRTNSSKMIIGQSFGGLLATEILFKKPALFDKYVIISPSLWWDDGSLLKQTTFLLSESNVPTQVYVAVGKEGLGPGSRPHVMEDDVKLLAGKLQNLKNPLLKVHYEYLPEEDHATILHQAVFNAMRKLFPK